MVSVEKGTGGVIFAEINLSNMVEELKQYLAKYSTNEKCFVHYNSDADKVVITTRLHDTVRLA